MEEDNKLRMVNPAEPGVVDLITCTGLQQNGPDDGDQRRKQHKLLTDAVIEDMFKVINAVSGKHVVSTSKYCFYKTFGNVKNHFPSRVCPVLCCTWVFCYVGPCAPVIV